MRNRREDRAVDRLLYGMVTLLVLAAVMVGYEIGMWVFRLTRGL